MDKSCESVVRYCDSNDLLHACSPPSIILESKVAPIICPSFFSPTLAPTICFTHNKRSVPLLSSFNTPKSGRQRILLHLASWLARQKATWSLRPAQQNRRRQSIVNQKVNNWSYCKIRGWANGMIVVQEDWCNSVLSIHSYYLRSMKQTTFDSSPPSNKHVWQLLACYSTS